MSIRFIMSIMSKWLIKVDEWIGSGLGLVVCLVFA